MQQAQQSRIPLSNANRFTVFVKNKHTKDYQALVKWQQWFEQKGVPSVLALTTSGYAVYREGLIEIDVRDESQTNFTNQ